MSAFSSSRAARLFTLCAAGAIGFQLALIGGAPWGALTQGGMWPGALPVAARAVAGVSAVLLIGMIAIVRARAGLVAGSWAVRGARLVWLVVGYCVLGVVLNAVTPSAAERRLWLPVVALMLVSSLRVAVAEAPTRPQGTT